MHSINSVVNPTKNYIREGDPASDMSKILAIQELELAKRVALELIRDCSGEVQASIKKAFEEAISGLA